MYEAGTKSSESEKVPMSSAQLLLGTHNDMLLQVADEQIGEKTWQNYSQNTKWKSSL